MLGPYDICWMHLIDPSKWENGFVAVGSIESVSFRSDKENAD